MPADSPIPSLRPIVFGEVLYDRFEDGTEVLGGAPFNVAWHLKGFGLEPLLIGRVGDDPGGRKVHAAMIGAGLATDGLQIDPERPTGEVVVSVADRQPTFAIAPDQAWDAVDEGAARAAVSGIGARLLYHGTLAMRSPVTAAALRALRDDLDLPVFLDVNLRPPWWTPATAAEALDGARWAKLNDEELATLVPAAADPASAARDLAAQHDLEAVIVTRGAEGAFWADRVGVIASVDAAPVAVAEPDRADTVGAGDAFAAVCIIGLLRGWSEGRTLSRSAEAAAAICGIRGAVPGGAEFHRRFLKNWR